MSFHLDLVENGISSSWMRIIPNIHTYIYTHISLKIYYTYIYIYNEKAAWQKPRSNHQPFQPTISYQCPVCLMLRITISEYKLVLNDLNGVSKDDFPIEH